jgi:hypothetical protein
VVAVVGGWNTDRDVNAIKPRDFLELLDRERRWFEFLMALSRCEVEATGGSEPQLAAMMLRARAWELRN